MRYDSSRNNRMDSRSSSRRNNDWNNNRYNRYGNQNNFGSNLDNDDDYRFDNDVGFNDIGDDEEHDQYESNVRNGGNIQRGRYNHPEDTRNWFGSEYDQGRLDYGRSEQQKYWDRNRETGGNYSGRGNYQSYGSEYDDFGSMNRNFDSDYRDDDQNDHDNRSYSRSYGGPNSYRRGSYGELRGSGTGFGGRSRSRYSR